MTHRCLCRLISQVFSVKLFSGGAPGQATRGHEHAQQRRKSVVALPPQSRVDPDYLQLNQSTARGAGHSFCPTNNIHFGEDRLHMRFHSAFTDKKGGADLFVAFS